MKKKRLDPRALKDVPRRFLLDDPRELSKFALAPPGSTARADGDDYLKSRKGWIKL